MMSAAVARRAQELAAQRVPFVTATVVRAQSPTSAVPGTVALVLADGAVEGFIGGVCAEQSVRAYSLRAMETEEAVLLRILPAVADDQAPVSAATSEATTANQEMVAGEVEAASEVGAVTVPNPCLSGGAVEVFLEPVLPGPRVMVVGQTPIADAIFRLGAELGLDVVAVDGATVEPGAGDLALVVASHGRDELHTLRLALAARLPYVGLVASPKRGASVVAQLGQDGVPGDLLALIDVPAGLDIGARTPAEIALSILARVVAVRRADDAARPQPASSAGVSSFDASAAPALAVDPICGMTIAAGPETLSIEHAGKTVYFCCESCRAKFAAQPEHAGATG